MHIAGSANLTATDCHSCRPPPKINIGPGELEIFKISLLKPGLGNRTHAFFDVIFHISDPCHQVSANLNDNPADIIEQVHFVTGTKKSLIALTDSEKCTIRPVEQPLRLLSLGDIGNGANYS